ncbi:MAG: helix-turn-helix domain-containing protein [Desulfobacterales bacterium]|jgi:DNA-binding transcriptional regulator YiaG
MAKKKQGLTTSEFGSTAGLSKSMVSKLIRKGKIKAEKISGKWMISPDQLKAKAVQKATKGTKTSPKVKTAKPAPKKGKKAKIKVAGTKKMLSIAEFAGMTYLTEHGVKQWLRQGRLAGQQNDKGEWQIEALNLDVPNVKRLLRQ